VRFRDANTIASLNVVVFALKTSKVMSLSEKKEEDQENFFSCHLAAGTRENAENP